MPMTELSPARTPATATPPVGVAPAVFGRKKDWVRIGGLLAVISVMHVVAWGMLLVMVVPAHLSAGTQVFGIGLGITAYTLGMRHAFDADHIAAIDNIPPSWWCSRS